MAAPDRDGSGPPFFVRPGPRWPHQARCPADRATGLWARGHSCIGALLRPGCAGPGSRSYLRSKAAVRSCPPRSSRAWARSPLRAVDGLRATSSRSAAGGDVPGRVQPGRARHRRRGGETRHRSAREAPVPRAGRPGRRTPRGWRSCGCWSPPARSWSRRSSGPWRHDGTDLRKIWEAPDQEPIYLGLVAGRRVDRAAGPDRGGSGPGARGRDRQPACPHSVAKGNPFYFCWAPDSRVAAAPHRQHRQRRLAAGARARAARPAGRGPLAGRAARRFPDARLVVGRPQGRVRGERARTVSPTDQPGQPRGRRHHPGGDLRRTGGVHAGAGRQAAGLGQPLRARTGWPTMGWRWSPPTAAPAPA